MFSVLVKSVYIVIEINSLLLPFTATKVTTSKQLKTDGDSL